MVVGIHLAPGARLAVRDVDSVHAESGAGLVGDRYHGTRNRHLSIQSASLLADAARDLGCAIPFTSTRRNLTISGGAIPTRRGARITIGKVELEVVRSAPPCRLLDDAIGRGAVDALQGRAGSICRILTSGVISVGDPVRLHDPDRGDR